MAVVHSILLVWIIGSLLLLLLGDLVRLLFMGISKVIKYANAGWR